MNIRTAHATTNVVRIYLSGPIESAKALLREECMRKGLCVTIEPTLFIYTGGEEAGYVVGLLNYPRFPSEDHALYGRAMHIAEMLLEMTHQHSALVVTPGETVWLTKREPESAASGSSHAARSDEQDSGAPSGSESK